MCPYRPENLPSCSFDWILFPEIRSWIDDPHDSNGWLYDAGHRSQNLTQLAPTRQDAVLHPSGRCPTQVLDVGASPAVGNPACSPSPDVSSRFPSVSG